MPAFNESGFVREFQQLTTRAVLGENVAPDLAHWVRRVVAGAKLAAPNTWQRHVGAVQDQLQAQLWALKVPEPTCPDVFKDLAHRARRACHRTAIEQLDTALGPAA